MTTIIQQFYTSFSQLDAEGMAQCYHDDVLFEDPAFGQLQGERAKNMWRMLCESQKDKDFRVEFSDIRMDGERGFARWEAFYTFGKTGRKVHNKIDAKFCFQDGKIIEHLDYFNLHLWAGQAMGLQGTLIGWTSFFRKKLQAQTNRMLDKFEQKR